MASVPNTNNFTLNDVYQSVASHDATVSPNLSSCFSKSVDMFFDNSYNTELYDGNTLPVKGMKRFRNYGKVLFIGNNGSLLMIKENGQILYDPLSLPGANGDYDRTNKVFVMGRTSTTPVRKYNLSDQNFSTTVYPSSQIELVKFKYDYNQERYVWLFSNYASDQGQYIYQDTYNNLNLSSTSTLIAGSPPTSGNILDLQQDGTSNYYYVTDDGETGTFSQLGSTAAQIMDILDDSETRFITVANGQYISYGLLGRSRWAFTNNPTDWDDIAFDSSYPDNHYFSKVVYDENYDLNFSYAYWSNALYRIEHRSNAAPRVDWKNVFTEDTILDMIIADNTLYLLCVYQSQYRIKYKSGSQYLLLMNLSTPVYKFWKY